MLYDQLVSVVLPIEKIADTQSRNGLVSGTGAGIEWMTAWG